MIKFVTHNEIDKRRWDECIANAINGNIYVWSWYLDIIHPRWDALIDGDYERVMPIAGKQKIGISYLFQPFFAQQLGIFSRTHLTQDHVDNFIEVIKNRFRITDYNLNMYNKVDYESPYIIKHRNIELDLISNYQALYNNYSSNTKRNLSKAEKQGLSFINYSDPEDVIQLFRNNKGKELKHWGDKEYERLLLLINTAIEKEHCITCGINDIEQNTIAGAVFMCSHDKIIFFFSGCDESNKHNHALTMLIDSIIRSFSETQNTFDFEGSDNDGLARFYKGFGGKETFYPGIRYNNLNIILKFAFKLIGK